MNRRSLLSVLAAAGAATATSYFLPPISGWKSDVIAQPDDWRFKLNRTIKMLIDKDDALTGEFSYVPMYRTINSDMEFLKIRIART